MRFFPFRNIPPLDEHMGGDRPSQFIAIFAIYRNFRNLSQFIAIYRNFSQFIAIFSQFFRNFHRNFFSVLLRGQFFAIFWNFFWENSGQKFFS